MKLIVVILLAIFFSECVTDSQPYTHNVTTTLVVDSSARDTGR